MTSRGCLDGAWYYYQEYYIDLYLQEMAKNVLLRHHLSLQNWGIEFTCGWQAFPKYI